MGALIASAVSESDVEAGGAWSTGELSCEPHRKSHDLSDLLLHVEGSFG